MPSDTLTYAKLLTDRVASGSSHSRASAQAMGALSMNTLRPRRAETLARRSTSRHPRRGA